jgi:hypothetical protein
VAGGVDSLPPAARKRLEEFAGVLERVPVEDLTLYAVGHPEDGSPSATEAATVARERGLTSAIEGARTAVRAYVTRSHANAHYRGAGSLNVGPSLGPTEDWVRVMRSLDDAVIALVLDDSLREADRSELLGAWANLLP